MPITPDQLRADLARLGLTQSGAARRWRVAVRTVQQWCAGDREIPGTVETIISLESGELVPRAKEVECSIPSNER